MEKELDINEVAKLMEENEIGDLEELKKLLYAKVNSISDDILSKSDKDARKRQIKKLIDKLEDEPQSKWDLSAEIAKALSADV